MTDPAYPPPNPGQTAPPPAYQAPPPHQSQPQTVVVTQPAVTVVATGAQFRDAPVPMACPYCKAQIVTAIDYQVGMLVYIICLVLALVGCWLGCCLIPCCVDGCKDVVHSCPNCKNVVGRFSRM